MLYKQVQGLRICLASACEAHDTWTFPARALARSPVDSPVLSLASLLAASNATSPACVISKHKDSGGVAHSQSARRHDGETTSPAVIVRKLYTDSEASASARPSPSSPSAHTGRRSTHTLLATAGAQLLSPLQGLSLDHKSSVPSIDLLRPVLHTADATFPLARVSPARSSATHVDLTPLTRPLPSAAALNSTKPFASGDSMSASPQMGRSISQLLASDGSGRSPRKSVMTSAPESVVASTASPAAASSLAVLAASPSHVPVSARSPVRGQLHLSSRALSGALSLLNAKSSAGAASASSPAESPSHSHSSSSHPSASPVSPATGDRVVTVSGSSHTRSPRESVSVSAAGASPYLFAAATHAPATAASLLRASGSQSPLRGSLQSSGRGHRSPSLGPPLSPIHAPSSSRGGLPSLSALPPSQSPQLWPASGLHGASPSHIASFEAAFRGGRTASLSIGAAAASTPLDQAAAESAVAITAALAAGEWSPGARALSRAAHSRGTAAVADSVRELLRADSRAGRSTRPLTLSLTTTRPAHAADTGRSRRGDEEVGSSFDDASPSAAGAGDDDAPYSPAAAAIARHDEGHDDASSAIAGDGADDLSPREAGDAEAERGAAAGLVAGLDDHQLSTAAVSAASNDDAGGWT